MLSKRILSKLDDTIGITKLLYLTDKNIRRKGMIAVPSLIPVQLAFSEKSALKEKLCATI